jgi:hypothetical protein
LTSSTGVCTGRCHCGAMRFEVTGAIEGVELCNCSIGTRVAKHYFCRTCGISPFRRARSNPHDVDVNVRCVEGVDLETLHVKRYDGRNWEQAL